jgi:filamentous hemagglutinin family protein
MVLEAARWAIYSQLTYVLEPPMTLNRSLCCFTVTSLGILLSTNTIYAQVIPDSSVNTIVTSPNRRDFTITGGGTAGTNLFHSFTEFSIPTGGAAIFDNALAIQNIFSRVTGPNISNLDGRLRANGTASLFLLNPNGVIFGPKASLNIGGSFLATTATTIKFADGVEFSATNPTPLLTMRVPIGLQFGSTPGNIALLRDDANTGSILSLAPKQGFLLAGNNLQLNNTKITITGGRIDFAAVAGSGTIDLIPAGNTYRFNVPASLPRSNVTLTGTAESDTRIVLSGAPAGSASITAQNLTNNKAWIEGRVVGAGSVDVPSGDFIFDILDTIDMQGGFFSTRINAGGVGKAGNIFINTGSLRMQQGAQITATLAGTGQAGNITVTARDRVSLAGYDADNYSTILSSSLRRTGKGNAGSVTVNAPAIFIGGGGVITGPSQGDGNGANIILNTNSLDIAGGGQIYTTTERAGKAGMIEINAGDRVTIVGDDPNWTDDSLSLNPYSGIYVTATTGSTGPGGDIRITTPSLQVKSGGQIDASTNGKGVGGTIAIQAANQLEVSGVSQFDQSPSTISTQSSNLGDGGILRLTAGDIRLDQSATITSRSSGDGDGGTIAITARSLSLNNATINAETAAGNGGNITLNLDQLLKLRDRSLLSASAGGRGNGGNLDIKAQFMIGLENSDIVANAIQGRGGNIQITTQGIFGLKNRPFLTDSNDITASSEFGLNGTVEVNNIGIDPNAGLTELPGDLVDPSQQITAGCNPNQGSSFAITGRGGSPGNPVQIVNADRPWQDTRNIAPATVARNITPATVARNIAPAPLIEATGWQLTPQGQPQLIVGKAIDAPKNITCTR